MEVTPSGGPFQAPACDILLLLCREGCDTTLFSAAALHNAVLKANRAALEALCQPGKGGMPVFAVHQGVFAARLEGDLPPPLRSAAEAPELALNIMLHPGDVLCLNPFLVWANPTPGFTALPVITEPTRLQGPFAPAAAAPE
jgi:hypothetical protein